MKPASWLALILVCLVSGIAIAQQTAKPTTTADLQTPAAKPAPERQVAAVTEETVALRAQLVEMRRSEDRLLATVHWTLGAVVAIAVGLAAFSWWSSNKIHQQDLQRVKEDLFRQLSEVIGKAMEESTRKLEDAQRKEASRLQAETIAFTMWKVSALRLHVGDIAGAIDAALEQASAVRAGNSNYTTHAIIALTDAFLAAIDQRVAIAPDKVELAQRLLVQSVDPFGEYGRKLTESIERYLKASAAYE